MWKPLRKSIDEREQTNKVEEGGGVVVVCGVVCGVACGRGGAWWWEGGAGWGVEVGEEGREGGERGQFSQLVRSCASASNELSTLVFPSSNLAPAVLTCCDGCDSARLYADVRMHWVRFAVSAAFPH